MNYSDGYHRDYLKFVWNNTTGAVSSAKWEYTFGATTYTFFRATTPSSSVAPGYDATGASATLSPTDIYFTTSSGLTRLSGVLANLATTSHASFGGVTSQTGSSWMGGYGTVSCVNE